MSMSFTIASGKNKFYAVVGLQPKIAICDQTSDQQLN